MDNFISWKSSETNIMFLQTDSYYTQYIITLLQCMQKFQKCDILACW